MIKTNNNKNKWLSYDDVMRINEREEKREQQKRMGIREIRIRIPKRFKIIGVSLVGVSVVAVDGGVCGVLGVAVLQSPHKRNIIPNFKRLFTTNIKKLRRMAKNAYMVCLYDGMGVRRWKR